MNSKWFYLVMGLFLGVIFITILITIPGSTVSAVSSGNLESGGAAEGIIALSAIDTQTNRPILWVVNAENKSLLLYDYYQDHIRLVALRDIQFDLNVPEGFYLPASRKRNELTPLEIKKEFKKWREELKKREEEIKKRDKKK